MDLLEFPVALGRLSKHLSGPQLKQVVDKVADEIAKKDFDQAVRREGSRKGSLGDASMSNWRCGNPIQIAAARKTTTQRGAEVEAVIRPKGRSAGPWRVLEDGRKYGSASDLILVGKVRKKTGTRRAKSRGRNQSSTAGKDTWTDGTKIAKQNSGRRMDEATTELVKNALGMRG